MTRRSAAAFAFSLLWVLMAPAMALSVCAATIAGAGNGSNAVPSDARPPYPTEPAPAPPALENPVTGIMEAGQLIVTLSATRRYEDGPSVNYGYRTGQLIPVTVVISADPHVMIDLGVLKGDTLNKDGSKFEMVVPPVVSHQELDGKKITIIRLVVRTWAMDTAVPFNCQFHYATGYLPDQKTPDWKLATTPDFIITTSRTATDSSNQLLDGDMSVKTTATVWWSQPLEYAGALVMALVPLWLAYRFWAIWRHASMASRAQKAWKIIDTVERQRASAGHQMFSPAQLKTISAALRQYLDIESIPTVMADEPLERFFHQHEKAADMKALSMSALAKLDRAVYSRSTLTVEETNALVQEISRIIPRD